MHPGSGIGMIEFPGVPVCGYETHTRRRQMDGSRRYSKVYCKTQAGADALASARGILSSSARQLLILLDGQRDFDELSGIFGEEALYRLLPQLESQGYIEPLNERVETRPETPAETTVKTTAPVTISPATVQKSAPTTLPATAPSNPPVEAPAVTITTKKAPRFLAVPLAILASLLMAQAIVNWVFEREERVAETSQAQEATPAAPAARSPAPGGTSSLPSSVSGIATAPPESSPPAKPASSLPAPDRQHSSPQQSAAATPSPATLPDQAMSEATARAKAQSAPPANTSRPAAAEPAARSATDGARMAPRSKAASESPAAPSKHSAPEAPALADQGKLALSMGAKAPGESTSAASKALPSGSDETASAAGSANGAGAPTPGVAPAVSILHVRSRVLPTISKRALQSGVYAGHAVVRLHVNSSGRVERVELVSASPPEVYGPDVQQALEQWTFEPPSNPAQFTLELDFREKTPEAAAVPAKPVESPQE